ncbi:HAD-IC family P-type ATPase [Microbacterium capsulatum]|uniref:HAD-IC family P-type ATPase n=1 Tax=Microbacterium capsulatum TaxID=3041921 RepID=A0ABU0XBV5_9MICO|nr:HAD-IC family P-type ATPase [Microbacterium sp. ASV81]MDQ4212591.1 HAD-IC family P-type ATPase [Microbacterium sp. ASV81]
MSAPATPSDRTARDEAVTSAPLTAAQVAERVARGETNEIDSHTSRSFGEIFRANAFTRVNAIYFVLFLLILGTGYLIDGLFGLLIVVNSVIGMVQEVRAKRTLDRLAVLSRAPARVERAEGILEIPVEEIVLDDVVLIASGDQIPVDGDVLDAVGLEVDESLLTGESEPVLAGAGYSLLSGSFVSAGSASFRATAVGEHAYAAKLAKEASQFRKPASQLRAGIDTILKYVTWALIPVGVLTIVNQIWGHAAEWRNAVRGLVAALVPMVPEGLVLITSVAMAVGVVRLGRRNCLVQDLPAIEQLARVDVVCTDKTGTLTEDGMRVSAVEQLLPGGDDRVEGALAAIGRAEGKPNSSMTAILEHVGQEPALPVDVSVAFSSVRKWAAAQTTDEGSWVLGAPDVLLPEGDPARIRSDALASEGLRVLALTRTDAPMPDPEAPGDGLPDGLAAVALVILDQRLREEAPGAIAYFAAQNVDIKVISGDNPAAVGAIAAEAGVPNGRDAVDARTLDPDSAHFDVQVRDASAFGRVTPSQKRAMVHALQGDGRVVAMTGDGVNDVLALKDSDVGVAMGSGSPAARAVSRIVLLDNSFATLPHVVAEGRRVIGNIERVATLFLTKTLYSILLALLVAVTAVPFPFLPRHVTLIAWFTIGIPAFFLALAPNTARAQDGFVRRVLDAAVPGGIGAAVASYGAYLTARAVFGTGHAHRVITSSTAFLALVIVAFFVLITVARPYRLWKVVLVGSMVAAMLAVVLTPLGSHVFDVDLHDPRAVLIACAFGAGGIGLRFLSRAVLRAVHGVIDRRRRHAV